MTQVHIDTWENLANDSWDGLIVGNGGSIALHPGFAYTSLFEAASSAGRLPTTQPVFTALKQTPDFEHVMLALSHAMIIGDALGQSKACLSSAYDEVRNALIKTVSQVHCLHADIRNELHKIAKFASQFRTIVTFNYAVLGNARGERRVRQLVQGLFYR